MRRRTHTVVVLVGRVHKGVLEAIGYARSLRPDRLLAVSVVSNAEEQEQIVGEWERRDMPVELRTVYSPYRELQRSVLRFVDELDDEHPDDFLTIVLPEFVLDHWWEKALHNQSALILRARLRARPNTIVTSLPVPHRRERRGRAGQRRVTLTTRMTTLPMLAPVNIALSASTDDSRPAYCWVRNCSCPLATQPPRISATSGKRSQ